MDHRVSGDNRIHYHGHHLYAVSFTGLSWGNPVCRSDQTQQVGIHSSLTVSWSRLMVGRSSCGGRVSVIFSGGPDHKPIRAQTWMRLTNQEGLVYSTVTLLYCTVVRGNVMLCFTPGQDDQPEEDFHQDQAKITPCHHVWVEKYSVFPSWTELTLAQQQTDHDKINCHINV